MDKYDIRNVFDIPEWEKIQDKFSELTRTAIITVDYKGNPVTKHSGRTDFCTIVRSNPMSCKRCYKCDSLAGYQAMRQNKPFIYLCHCGIIDVAIPVVIKDIYVGAVLFGEVRLKESGSTVRLDDLLSEMRAMDDKREEDYLLDKFNCLPELDYETIQSIADTIFEVIKYMVANAEKRMDTEPETGNKESLLPPIFDGEGFSADILRGHLQSLDSPPQKSSLHNIDLEKTPSERSLIYPAIAYIKNNPHIIPGMKDMAALCHVSTSYFSRMFSKEIGSTFTDYVNQYKVSLAKDMLRDTDETISTIALDLGYQDSSYFIKVFSKYVGVTPAVFRNRK